MNRFFCGGLMVGLWMMGAASGISSPTPDRPNVLFLITDDAHKHYLNWLPEGKNEAGEPRFYTPRLSRFASRATVMRQQYVTSPVCTPSRFSCLTGNYPSRSRSQEVLKSMDKNNGQATIGWNTYITPGSSNIARHLKTLGYTTAFVGKNHVIEAEGMETPEWTADPHDPQVKALLERNYQRQREAVHAAGFDYAASLYYNNPGRNGVAALNAHNLDWIAQGALAFLDQRQHTEGPEKPFFLWLASTVPHGPADSEHSWKADRRITPRGMLDEPLEILSSAEKLTARLKAESISPEWSQENMLWLDDLFGVVLEKLEAAGELENTVIFFFNDHGQMAKGTLYQGGVHGESFVWRSEGFPAGAESFVPVSNIDFAPTILQLAGASPAPDDFDGKSFLPVLEDHANALHDSLYFEMGFTRGVKKGDWKYIALRYPHWVENASHAQRQRWLDRNNRHNEKRGIPIWNTDPMAPFSHVQIIPGGGDAERRSMDHFPAYSERDQLYHLKYDPGEQNNLADDPAHAEKLEEMKGELKRHLRDLPGRFAEFKDSN